MWDSAPILSGIGTVGVYVALGAALVSAFAGAVSSIASSRASDIIVRESQERIARADARAAEANARAEEAKAETAKTNERIQKMQEARHLTKEQIDKLDGLFRSDTFQKPTRRKLRVSSVEDAEARMFAMEFQKLMESCGINIYPTDGGFPGTCAQLSPDASPLILTVRSGEVHGDMQHLAIFERTMIELGFGLKLEYDPSLKPDEGVLYVMRKQVV